MLKRFAIALAALSIGLMGCSQPPAQLASGAKETQGAKMLATTPRGDGSTTPTGIPLDADWKKQGYAFAVKNLKHPSWGLAHAERNLQNALSLAELEHLDVDRDVLFAAAYLHDLGGMPGHEKEGVDHAVRSAELAPSLLQSWGFPMAKLPKVKDAILSHVYYGTVSPTCPEAKVFHDADLLDFLGTMGTLRLVAATHELSSDATLASPLKIARQFADDLPGKLFTEAAKAQAKLRVSETQSFFRTLAPYTFNDNAL